MHESKLVTKRACVRSQKASCLARHASVKTCLEVRAFGDLYLCYSFLQYRILWRWNHYVSPEGDNTYCIGQGCIEDRNTYPRRHWSFRCNLFLWLIDLHVGYAFCIGLWDNSFSSPDHLRNEVEELKVQYLCKLWVSSGMLNIALFCDMTSFKLVQRWQYTNILYTNLHGSISCKTGVYSINIYNCFPIYGSIDSFYPHPSLKHHIVSV
jgi:hypothetical protein